MVTVDEAGRLIGHACIRGTYGSPTAVQGEPTLLQYRWRPRSREHLSASASVQSAADRSSVAMELECAILPRFRSATQCDALRFVPRFVLFMPYQNEWRRSAINRTDHDRGLAFFRNPAVPAAVIVYCSVFG